MKNKQFIPFLIILTAVIGYYSGYKISHPLIDGIGIKSSENTLVNKLKNDQKYCEEVKSLLSYINIIAGDYLLNAELTKLATNNTPELIQAHERMQNLISLGNNVKALSASTLEAINNEAGEYDSEIPSLYHRTISTYIALEKGISIVKNFIIEADEYLEEDDNPKLAFARDLWVDHLTLSSIMHKDQMGYAIYSSLKNFSTDKNISEYISSLTQENKTQLAYSEALKAKFKTTKKHSFNVSSGIKLTGKENLDPTTIDLNNISSILKREVSEQTLISMK